LIPARQGYETEPASCSNNFFDWLINFHLLATPGLAARLALPFCDAATAEALILLHSLASLMFDGFVGPVCVL
jgi:hypothetical protein